MKCWPIVLDQGALETIRQVLGKEPNVLAAWLFGSQASGRSGPDSDVDIAILCKERLTYREHLRIAGELERSLGVERVDLVSLDASQPVLAFEAIRGRQVLDRDPSARVAFVSLVSRVYEDVMANLERALFYRQRAQEARTS